MIVADEEAGNYKIVAWNDVTQALSLAKGESSSPPAAHAVARTVQPKVETEPTDSYGDSADDPAIWVDRRDPSRSVVIGTDKKLGLNVYDLKGKRLQVVPDGRMNNVDLREGFIDGAFARAKKGAPASAPPSMARGPRSWQWQTALVFLSPSTSAVLRPTKSRWSKRPSMPVSRPPSPNG